MILMLLPRNLKTDYYFVLHVVLIEFCFVLFCFVSHLRPMGLPISPRFLTTNFDREASSLNAPSPEGRSRVFEELV